MVSKFSKGQQNQLEMKIVELVWIGEMNKVQQVRKQSREMSLCGLLYIRRHILKLTQA